MKIKRQETYFYARYSAECEGGSFEAVMFGSEICSCTEQELGEPTRVRAVRRRKRKISATPAKQSAARLLPD